MGAWIETSGKSIKIINEESLPIWERGLKLSDLLNPAASSFVAPYMGAWIETGDCRFYRAGG